MKKVIIGSNYARQETNNRYEVGCCELESKTVPDEDMSIKELMKRANSGLSDERQVSFMDVDSIDQVSDFMSPHFDLTDLDRISAKEEELKKAYTQAVESVKEKELEKKKIEKENQLKALAQEISAMESKKGGEG
jgi:hypothetical protein